MHKILVPDSSPMLSNSSIDFYLLSTDSSLHAFSTSTDILHQGHPHHSPTPAPTDISMHAAHPGATPPSDHRNHLSLEATPALGETQPWWSSTRDQYPR